MRRAELSSARVPTALVHLVAFALLISGADKIRKPRPSTAAWRAAGLPGRRFGDRLPGLLVGSVEVALGLAAILTGSAVAAVGVAGLYLAFAWFVRRLSARDATAGCGCFSASSAPPGKAHVVLDIAAACGALTAAIFGARPVADIVDDGIALAVPYLALLSIGGILLLTGPALTGELRHLRSGAAPRTFTINTEASGRH